MASNLFPVTKKGLRGHKLLQVEIPPQDWDYLVLQALYNYKTLAGLVRELLEEWINEKTNLDHDHVVRVLASRAYSEWTQRLAKRGGKPFWQTNTEIASRFREFEVEAKIRLMKRGLAEQYADEIVSVITSMRNLDPNISSDFFVGEKNAKYPRRGPGRPRKE